MGCQYSTQRHPSNSGLLDHCRLTQHSAPIRRNINHICFCPIQQGVEYRRIKRLGNRYRNHPLVCPITTTCSGNNPVSSCNSLNSASSRVSLYCIPPCGNCHASWPILLHQKTCPSRLLRIMPTFALYPSESITCPPLSRTRKMYPLFHKAGISANFTRN